MNKNVETERNIEKGKREREEIAEERFDIKHIFRFIDNTHKEAQQYYKISLKRIRKQIVHRS